MRYLSLLKTEAVKRGLLDSGSELGMEKVFELVRDMPYRRASDRDPRTTITEWKGTCSGKHYLLKELFAEFGYSSKVIACTTIVPVEPGRVPEPLTDLYEAANRRFVDVHNYLILELPEGGEMIVDATWPLSARDADMVVNEVFVLGQNQQIAAEPIESWLIPGDRDPQEFKDELLHAHFTPAELEFREEVIKALGDLT